MTKQNLLTALLAGTIGWVLVSFAAGVTLSLNPLLLVFVLIVVILVLRILDRADWLFIVAGLVIGGLVSLLVPALAPKFIEPAIAFAILLFAAYKV